MVSEMLIELISCVIINFAYLQFIVIIPSVQFTTLSIFRPHVTVGGETIAEMLLRKWTAVLHQNNFPAVSYIYPIWKKIMQVNPVQQSSYYYLNFYTLLSRKCTHKGTLYTHLSKQQLQIRQCRTLLLSKCVRSWNNKVPLC